MDYPVYEERVSSGVEGLDEMLRGGYYRGSSVLVSGAPGTAKTTLGGAFLDAACRRGERALMISFDEAAEAIVRNLASVNVRLAPHLGEGKLRIHSVRTRIGSAEEHLLRINEWIDAHQPRCIVVDPLSALLKAGGALSALSVAERLIHLAKKRGCTLLCTSLLGVDGGQEGTPLAVSTIADTWIQLSYLNRGGERNRALSVVKSRGTGHSSQVRELLLSDEGIELAEVYTAGGEVLMGTLRWEREAEIEEERERMRVEVTRKRAELELAQAEAEAQMEAIHRNLDALRAELAAIETGRQKCERSWEEQHDELQTRRRTGGGEA
jgi:circadian clock protein KaiC